MIQPDFNIQLTLPLPVSDNRRFIMGRGKSRFILSPESRTFLESVQWILKKDWPQHLVLYPTPKHQLHITAQVFVPNWKSDSSNYIKILKDSLERNKKNPFGIYNNDRLVHLDFRDVELDKKNPRVVLTIPVSYVIAVEEANSGDTKLLPNHREYPV